MIEHLEDGDLQSIFDGLLSPEEEMSFLRHIALCQVCQRRFLEYSSIISSLNADLKKALDINSEKQDEPMARLEEALMAEAIRLNTAKKAGSWVRANPAYLGISRSVSLIGQRAEKGFGFVIRRVAQGMMDLTRNQVLSRTRRQEKPKSTLERLKSAAWKEVTGSIRKGRVLAWVR